MKIVLRLVIVLISGGIYTQTELIEQDSTINFINCPSEFPGGNAELTKYIKDNFDIKDIDSTKFEYGTLFITFWVEKDGCVTGIDLMNRKRESITKENATPFKSMPNWIPACDKSGPIRDKVWLPLNVTP